MKLLDKYFDLQAQIFEYFGYKENWCVIPLDDCRSYWWHVTGESGGHHVLFSDKGSEKDALQDFLNENGYSNEIYTQRFLPRWVYRGEHFTMICVDTHTDGNKFLSVFDNSKEIKVLK